MPPATVPEPDDELTIEQLAVGARSPVHDHSHVPAPGPVAAPRAPGKGRLLPGPAHRARLELIASLQERGYSLAAIKELVDTWQEGRSLTQVLGLEAGARPAR